ncbi:tetratricopeptide repeat protein [Galbibacter mesophilus]|uniref:tetratricopeptide repeat protein n=1 Tax=Galbibacter mesophilus TaxID=379069 RepID=UPI00191FAAEF|nr:tetratricopeptide repeat protein [Galbibacter mesophilus]MCM5661888.1 tetratricopeptide repeat protein [Galbibacter mesophilus]
MTESKHCSKPILLFLLLFISLVANSQQKGFPELKINEIDIEFSKLKDNLAAAKEKKDTTEIALAYLHFAHFYKNVGALNEAIHHLLEAARFFKEKISVLAFNTKMEIGHIHFTLKHFITAKHFYSEALLISQKLNYKNGEAKAEGALGNCFEKQSDYEKALLHQNNSLQLFLSLKDSVGLAMVNENIGSAYEDLERYKEAENYFSKALSYANKNLKIDRKINILNNLGDVHRKRGDVAQGIIFTYKAKHLAEETNNKHQLESAYKDLSKAYRITGDFEEAYINLVLSDSIREEILELQNVQQVNSLQALYGAKEKDSEIKLLTKQNEVNKAREQLMMILILVLMAASVVVYFYLKKRKAHEIKLQSYQQKILKQDLEKKKLKEESLEREIELKTSSLSKYSLHLAHKNRTLTHVAQTLNNIKGRKRLDIDAKLTELVKEIEGDLSEKKEWNQFMDYFEQIHPSFFDNLKSKSKESLSNAELRLSMLLRLNLSSKEIASILYLTADSVRVARYRLRKKIAIQGGEELTQFLQQL